MVVPLHPTVALWDLHVTVLVAQGSGKIKIKHLRKIIKVKHCH